MSLQIFLPAHRCALREDAHALTATLYPHPAAQVVLPPLSLPPTDRNSTLMVTALISQGP